PTGQQLCRYLQLNEVAAKPLTVGLDGRLTGEVILFHAKALGCDLLIKGAYTQSRLRQMIFGGTTRYILSNAELPVLMAHWRWWRASFRPCNKQYSTAFITEGADAMGRAARAWHLWRCS